MTPPLSRKCSQMENEVVPGLVEVEVAVPRLSSAEW